MWWLDIATWEMARCAASLGVVDRHVPVRKSHVFSIPDESPVNTRSPSR
jgi:hypothetical protein